ncbi:Trm112 family protein [Psychrobium sp. MM17-31]|uniref:Trm112 family protein n=1 Tax=Psychrobium sp. MM17-31 TaxID=2917758 RepID=UPI001EF65308|nr:Trm112 family protein [Psychrobium sp. MM17-31]MCG7531656.1 Trm112 family protein [Psychrobium sp. MM17-31]
MAFDVKLLDIIACPVSKGKLEYDKENNVLICRASRLVYPINDSIPVLLEEQATPLEE